MDVVARREEGSRINIVEFWTGPGNISASISGNTLGVALGCSDTRMV
jgi:hypothetical protein